MKIEFNTDDNIHGTEAIAAKVGDTVEHALEHISSHITRVEIHLSDENAGKGGQEDKRCMLEARLEGRQPVAVTHHAATIDHAVHGAAQKLAHLLESTVGRLHEHRFGAPVACLESSWHGPARLSPSIIGRLL